MADVGYVSKVYLRQGGDALVIASGGMIEDQTGANRRWADKTITVAQMLALFATPVVIVPAPGVGFAIYFDSAVLYKPAGTAYGGIATTEDLAIKYTDAAGLALAECEATGFLDQTTAQTRFVRARPPATTGDTSFVQVDNAALVLHMLIGEITTGDSVLKVRTYYRVVPTVL